MRSALSIDVRARDTQPDLIATATFTDVSSVLPQPLLIPPRFHHEPNSSMIQLDKTWFHYKAASNPIMISTALILSLVHTNWHDGHICQKGIQRETKAVRHCDLQTALRLDWTMYTHTQCLRLSVCLFQPFQVIQLSSNTVYSLIVIYYMYI